MLRYKGYVGVVQFDDEAMLFHGDVIGLRDVITFQGKTPEEIKKEFKTSIEGYLDWCKELGQEPEKPFSGEIHLRMSPDLHAQLAIQAKAHGMSLNSFIEGALETTLGKEITFLNPMIGTKPHRRRKKTKNLQTT
jgi:predicted HicB family RNase H-like nuclease